MPKLKSKKLTNREIYLNNRGAILVDFNAHLEEALKGGSSVDGIICGMDFKQMSIKCAFLAIREQEEYIAYTKKYKPSYVVLKEEEKILKDMIKKAKKVFGENYKPWYNNTFKD